METKALEINLISAQELMPPSANLRRMQTYAVVWIDSSTKLRSQIDRVGGDYPTWNDKFLFKVSPEFLYSQTSGVSFEIYAVGRLRDPLIGTVRFLISNLPPSFPTDTTRAIFDTSLLIHLPCGRFHGALNISAVLMDSSDFTVLNRASAIGYRDLMGESVRRRKHRDSKNLKCWKEVRGLATNLVRSSLDGCRLPIQRRLPQCLSDQNLGVVQEGET